VKTVLIVDDELAIRETMEQILNYDGYAVQKAASGSEALGFVEKSEPDVILLDIKMPGMDGFEVLEKLQEIKISAPVIIISGHGTIETAVEAVKSGAYDYLEKPLDRSRLLVTLANCLNHQQVLNERETLRTKIGSGIPLVGESQAIRDVRRFIAKVGPTEGTVLITGENGTGKELVVNAIHRASLRAQQPLIEVNCAAIPRDLVESELFGHEKGSFTGADRQRVGKFEHADGGILFLDEIGDMGAEAQAKVLKAVEENRFQRVGGTETREVDVRIVAATNRDLSSSESGFRQDLFFRLNVLSIHLPPLRERDGDVELLLSWFMADLAGRLNQEQLTFSAETLAILRQYSWPGNVRELRNLVERLLILCSGPVVKPADLPLLPGTRASAAEDPSFLECSDFQEFKARSEGAFLQQKLKENMYNVSRTAEALGMQRSNLYKKISKYELRTQPEVD
jgi:two-component system, NtrC family, nitrogen regulation response regulator NtrX